MPLEQVFLVQCTNSTGSQFFVKLRATSLLPKHLGGKLFCFLLISTLPVYPCTNSKLYILLYFQAFFFWAAKANHLSSTPTGGWVAQVWTFVSRFGGLWISDVSVIVINSVTFSASWFTAVAACNAASSKEPGTWKSPTLKLNLLWCRRSKAAN